jgi:hypothetical protein
MANRAASDADAGFLRQSASRPKIATMMDKNDGVEKAASRVIGFEAELENAGEAKTGGDLLAEAEAALLN